MESSFSEREAEPVEQDAATIDFAQMLPELAIELNTQGDLLLVLPESLGAQAMVNAVKNGFEDVYKRMFGGTPVMRTFRKDGENLVMVYERPQSALAT